MSQETNIAPLVSVVIATHNRAGLLSRAIESIRQQTITDWELIVVDDASADETLSVIQGWERDDSRITHISSQQNVGPGAARNLGFQRAQGRYIAVQDDDDIAVPERLEWQLDILEQQVDAGLVFSPVRWVDDRGQLLNIFPGIAARGEFPTLPSEIFTLLYLENNKIPNTTIMFRRDLFLRMGGYPETPWIGEDWFWYLKLAAAGIKLVALEQVIVDVTRGQRHQNLMSSTKAIISSQRQVLKMIADWLNENNIHSYDHLHKRALSNQLVREARMWGGRRGLGLCGRAISLWPANRFAWLTILEFLGRGWRQALGTLSK